MSNDIDYYISSYFLKINGVNGLEQEPARRKPAQAKHQLKLLSEDARFLMKPACIAEELKITIAYKLKHGN